MSRESQLLKAIKRITSKENASFERGRRLMDSPKARHIRRSDAHHRQAWKAGKKAFRLQMKMVMDFIKHNPSTP